MAHKASLAVSLAGFLSGCRAVVYLGILAVAVLTGSVGATPGQVTGGTSVEPRAGAIVGGAWYSDGTPVPHARVRLRNVLTGRIEAMAMANEAGEFSFRDVKPGSYVVELTNDDGKVLTVGSTFAVGPGGTAATSVTLGSRVPWFNGFFANAAAAVASAAAAAGVTAIAPEAMRPVSADR